MTAALVNYEELESLGKVRNDTPMELAGLQARAIVYAIPTSVQDLERGWALARQALALARRLGDQGAEARALWNFQLLCTYAGRMDEAITYGEQAARLAGELGLNELHAYTLQDLSLPYLGVGRLAQAHRVLDEASHLWQMLGNRPMLAENSANRAFERVLAGHFNEGLDQSAASLQLSRSIRNDWGEVSSRVFAAMVHLARADFDRALEMTESLITNGNLVGHPGAILGREQQARVYASAGAMARAGEAWSSALDASARFLPFQPLVQVAYARFLLARGDLVAAETLLAKAADPALRKTLFNIEIEYRLALAEITAARGNTTAAIAQLETLVELLHETGAIYYLPETLQVVAGLLRGQNRLDEARTALEQAAAVASTLGARRWLWTILVDLGDLEAQSGDSAAAKAHLAEAASLVEDIAASLSAVELRASLLASPQAQRALASRL